MANKKICFIGSFSGGGTERVVFSLVNKLVKHHDSEVFVLNNHRGQLTFDLSNRVHYAELNCCGVWRKIHEIRQYIKSNDIGIVVSIEALMGIFTIPATIGSGVRNIVWEHANYYQTQGSRWTRLIRKIWLIYADQYIVLTQRDLNNFRKNERFIRCQLNYIYNPYSVTPVNHRYMLDNKRIVSVGHIRKIKNFIVIPSIFAKIADKFPDWTWHIYGSGQFNEEEALRQEIAKFHLQNRIIMEGRVNNLDTIYREAGIYALTSLQEGLPTVLLEALSYNVPCVSFDIETGPDEIIDDGYSGMLVKAYNEADFAASLEKLMSNDTLRMRYSSNAESSIKKFSMEYSFSKWEEVLFQ